MKGLSLVATSGGHSSLRCAGLSLSRPLLLRSTGSRRAGSVVVAHGPSCSAACGIFPDQGLNLCPLPWQADSQPLRHQGSPVATNFNVFSLSQKFKDWGALGIQVYVKCQGLFILMPTRHERLKEKFLKYCYVLFGHGVRLDFNTSVKNYTHIPQKRAAKHNLSSIKKSSHKNIPKFPYSNILLWYEYWKLKTKRYYHHYILFHQLSTFSFG